MPSDNAPQVQRRRFGSACSILLGGLGGLCVVTALLAVAGRVYFQQADFILPGVSAGGVALGGKSVRDAEQVLLADWMHMPPTIQLTAGKQAWPMASGALGLGLDAHATAEQAAAAGHGRGPQDLFGVVFNGLDVKPVVTFNAAVARQTLTRWSSTVTVPAQNAAFHLQNGQVITTPTQAGQELDVDTTLLILGRDPGLIVQFGYLPIVIRPVAPQVTDVSAEAEQVRQWLSVPLTINVYDPITDEWLTWQPAPETIAGWLEVQADANGQQQVIVLPERLTAYVTAQSAGLGAQRYVEAGDAALRIREALIQRQTPTLLVRHTPTTYTVQAGDNLTRIGFKTGVPYWRILEANPDAEARGLTPGQPIIIPSKDDLLPLPVVLHKRIVVSLSQQRAQIFENRQLLKEYVISTGMDSSPTQPGVFQVQTHELNAYASVWDLWMPHFLGIYEAWPDFMNGFHGLPMLAGGRRLWADVLGRPASYGCIILNLVEAEELYNWAENGVVVEVKP